MAYIAEPFGPPQKVQMATSTPKASSLEIVRFTSVDVLKGIAILLAWLVAATMADPNAPSQLKPGALGHVTPADCVFPALLVGIGAGLALAAAFSAQEKQSIGRFFLRALSRAFWLVLLGVLVESAVARHPVFDFGALQLLGIAYLINALLARLPIVARVFLAEALLLAFYGWVKMNIVPGASAGTFTAKSNLIQYYDAHVLTPLGLQGLLNLIGMTSVMMSGSVVGSLYVMDDSRWRRGLIFVAIGATLCFFGWLWSLDMPLSSMLWTSSYALFGTGVAIVALGFFNFLFDFEKGPMVAYVLTIPGSSIILALVGPPIFEVMILDVWHLPGAPLTLSANLHRWIATSFNPPLTTWIYPILFVLFWWTVLAITSARRKWLREKCESGSIIKV